MDLLASRRLAGSSAEAAGGLAGGGNTLCGAAATWSTCPGFPALELHLHLRVWEFKAVCNVQ